MSLLIMFLPGFGTLFRFLSQLRARVAAALWFSSGSGRPEQGQRHCSHSSGNAPTTRIYLNSRRRRSCILAPSSQTFVNNILVRHTASPGKMLRMSSRSLRAPLSPLGSADNCRAADAVSAHFLDRLCTPGRCASLLALLLCLIIYSAHGQSVTRITPGSASMRLEIAGHLRRDVHQVFNTSSGLPQDTVRQFLQARDGYMWMATEGGLVRFDGYDFAVFDKRNTPALGSDIINAVMQDSASHLWISTSGGLTEYFGSTFHHYSTRDGLPSDNVWAVAQDATGYMWAATTGGLARFEAGTFQSVSRSSGSFTGRMAAPFILGGDGTLWIVSSSAVTRVDRTGNLHVVALPSAAVDIAGDDDHALWIATASTLIHYNQEGTGSTIPLPSAGGNRLQALTVDREGMLWLGTNRGLYSRSIHASPAQNWKESDSAQGLPAGGVAKLFADSGGTLWIATDTGVFRHSHDRDSSYSSSVDRFAAAFEQDGFNGPDILTLYRDREGDLWAGSDSAGAAILRHSAFATFTRREGLPSDTVRSIYASPAQTRMQDLWIGTGAGLSLYSNGIFHNVGSAEGIASDEILALAGVPASGPGSQRLWIGTPDGLSYLAGTKTLTLTASDGLPDDSIRSLLLSRSGALWIGTGHGLACLPHADPAEARAIHTLTQSDGLASNVIGSLLEDTDGSLWVGTLNGLSHLTTHTNNTQEACNVESVHAQSFAGKDGLASPIVTALGTDGHGVVWIGTNGGGLFALEQGHVMHVGSPADYTAGRLPATIYSIVQDASGATWLGSSTGVDRVRSSDLVALAHETATAGTIAIAHFGVADGLRLNDLASNGHPEAALTAGGELWFATLKGASVVDTHDPSLTLPPPPVAVESVTIDDLAATNPAGQVLAIPPGSGRMAFHYAGLSMAQPSKVRYRYQLDHFDRTWIDAGTRRTAYYTNIPPGRYTFHVVAAFDGGAWSTADAEFHFTIAPHYYQTWWFYALVLMVLAAIAWQLYLYRLRQVELRFTAVLAERSRIAREIHDTLAQDIVGISVQLELVSRLMAKSVDHALLQLQETRALVRKSLADARSSIWDLRSPASGDGDLPSRLRTLARRLIADAKTDAKIALDIHITGTYRAFPETQESELLRIAQEALTNATRHARPKTIRVALIYHAAGARLEVQDDGRGFEVPEQKSGPTGHYGIRGMYERADRAHATLTIRSTPGSGTTVVADVAQQENKVRIWNRYSG